MNGLMHFVSDLIAVAPGPGNQSGANIATNLRNFIAPLVLLVIGVVALSYLFKKQLTQFFQFLALAVLVGVLFYTPNVIEKIATWVSSLFGGTTA